MNRIFLAALSGAVLLISACTPPVEAPEELGELLLFLYSNFETDTGDELVAGAEQMEEYLLSIDLEAEVDDRAVTPPILTDDYLGEAGKPSGADPEKQVPVALSGQSANGIEDALTLIGDTNQVCIANDSYPHYEREWTTDIDCFVDGTCDAASCIASIRYESFIAKVWFQEHQEFRRFELDDGRTVVIEKSWSEEQYPSDNESSTWDQRFALNVWLPNSDDKAMRHLSFWSSVTIPGVGADVIASLTKDALEEGFVNEDNFLAGGDCGFDRDSGMTPPF
jgi:hypothetical protein